MDNLKRILFRIISEKEKIYVIIDFYKVIFWLRKGSNEQIITLLKEVQEPFKDETPSYIKRLQEVHQQTLYIPGIRYVLPVGSWISRKKFLSQEEWEKLNHYCSTIIGGIPLKILSLLR